MTELQRNIDPLIRDNGGFLVWRDMVLLEQFKAPCAEKKAVQSRIQARNYYRRKLSRKLAA